MFVFFSVAIGKQAVYILPLYPALSLLMTLWFYHHGVTTSKRIFFYRILATVAGVLASLLLIIALGSLWNHDPNWFFSSIERFLKTKDRANLELIKNSLA